MQKNYFIQKNELLNPDQDVIHFLLNYSKSFKVLKTSKISFEIFVN
jgi:hypothetical protein